jgi:mannose-1-phosphate guanylyltransferase
MKTIAVIMAGGLGVRLWPKSTERRPKQFMHVLGDGTLIQNTVARLLPIMPIEDVFVVTTADLVHLVAEQLPDVPAENIIVEPFGRNTAPCIGLSTLHLAARFTSDTIAIVMPSDHTIYNVREFHLTLERACQAALQYQGLVTIGVTPTRAETGYGYIQVGDAIAEDASSGTCHIHKVTTFAEKPDAATAQRFLDAGDFVWNSGIFVGRIDSFQRKIDKYLPDHAPLFHILERHLGKESYHDTCTDFYRQMRSVSFDIGVMEKAQHVLVVDGAFGWSDVGSWDEIYRMQLKDGRNNVVEGNVVTLNTTNSLVIGSSSKMISLVGVDNLIVVETESSIMICKRGEAENVRDVVDLLRRRNIARNL